MKKLTTVASEANTQYQTITGQSLVRFQIGDNLRGYLDRKCTGVYELGCPHSDTWLLAYVHAKPNTAYSASSLSI